MPNQVRTTVVKSLHAKCCFKFPLRWLFRISIFIATVAAKATKLARLQVETLVGSRAERHLVVARDIEFRGRGGVHGDPAVLRRHKRSPRATAFRERAQDNRVLYGILLSGPPILHACKLHACAKSCNSPAQQCCNSPGPTKKKALPRRPRS